MVSDIAEMAYKCTVPYRPCDDAGVRWNDPDIGIEWPVDHPVLSAKDQVAPLLAELNDLSV